MEFGVAQLCLGGIDYGFILKVRKIHKKVELNCLCQKNYFASDNATSEFKPRPESDIKNSNNNRNNYDHK